MQVAARCAADFIYGVLVVMMLMSKITSAMLFPLNQK
jgi:hypothetical protein